MTSFCQKAFQLFNKLDKKLDFWSTWLNFIKKAFNRLMNVTLLDLLVYFSWLWIAFKLFSQSFFCFQSSKIKPIPTGEFNWTIVTSKTFFLPLTSPTQSSASSTDSSASSQKLSQAACKHTWGKSMIERNLELYLTVRLSVCRIKCCCFLSPFNCFSNHFNLISYFISFALCDLNTFYISNVSMQSCFLPKSGWNLSSIDILPPESLFATQYFDLMTGLDDVKLCTLSLSLSTSQSTRCA